MGNRQTVTIAVNHQGNNQNQITSTPVRQQEMAGPNDTISQIDPSAETKPFKAPSWYQKLTKKQFIGLVIIVSIIVAVSIALPIILSRVKSAPVLPVGFHRSVIQLNSKVVEQTFMELKPQENQKKRDIILHGMHKDTVQVTHLNTESVIRAFSEGSATIYEFLIPVFSIFEKFSLENKQKTPFSNWLQQFNKDPRKTVDQLVDTIFEIFSQNWSVKDGVEVQSKLNLTFVNAVETVWVMIEYNPFVEAFKVLPITEVEKDTMALENKGKSVSEATNLKSEQKEQKDEKTALNKPEDTKQPNNQQTSDNKPQQKDQTPTEQYKPTKQQTPQPTSPSTPAQTLLTQVMRQTVSYIKRKAEQSIEAYKQHSEEIKNIHKSMVDNDEIDEEWQTALLDCAVVRNLEFRCPFKSVEKLVPGMTEQKLMAPDGNYLLIYGLKIVLKQVQQKTQ